MKLNLLLSLTGQMLLQYQLKKPCLLDSLQPKPTERSCIVASMYKLQQKMYVLGVRVTMYLLGVRYTIVTRTIKINHIAKACQSHHTVLYCIGSRIARSWDSTL